MGIYFLFTDVYPLTHTYMYELSAPLYNDMYYMCSFLFSSYTFPTS